MDSLDKGFTGVQVLLDAMGAAKGRPPREPFSRPRLRWLQALLDCGCPLTDRRTARSTASRPTQVSRVLAGCAVKARMRWSEMQRRRERRHLSLWRREVARAVASLTALPSLCIYFMGPMH